MAPLDLMDRPMLTAILIAATLGLATGVGGTLILQRRGDAEPVAEVIPDVVEAALAPAVEQEQTKQQLVALPAQSVYADAVVADSCPPLTAALAAYSLAVAASQGEGSAAVNVEEAQVDVSRVLTAMIAGEVCAATQVDGRL